MSRNGKIAHLPRAIRDQLNQRLDDGQEAKELAAWLNSLPEVQAVLTTHFERRPINEVNLSQWKQGGFVNWQSLQQRREWLARLIEASLTLRAGRPSPSFMPLATPPSGPWPPNSQNAWAPRTAGYRPRAARWGHRPRTAHQIHN